MVEYQLWPAELQGLYINNMTRMKWPKKAHPFCWSLLPFICFDCFIEFTHDYLNQAFAFLGGIPELHHFSFNFYESKIGIRAVSTLEFSDFFMASSMTFDTAVLLYPTQYRHLNRPNYSQSSPWWRWCWCWWWWCLPPARPALKCLLTGSGTQ